jgi:hypothetical protein
MAIQSTSKRLLVVTHAGVMQVVEAYIKRIPFNKVDTTKRLFYNSLHGGVRMSEKKFRADYDKAFKPEAVRLSESSIKA